MNPEEYVQQISVFIENAPGRVAEICELLDEGGVNVRGFMVSDTNDYGILRLVVDKPDEGLRILSEGGHAAKARPILVVRLKDEPGELAHLLTHLANAGVNVTYSYSLISTFVAICATDIDDAYEHAQAAAVDLVSLQDLISDPV